MNEIQRIKTYTNGEVPEGKKVIIRVAGISNPKEILENFKRATIAFLRYKDLDENSSRWNRLLPGKIVQFVKQLTRDDYSNDDLLFPIHSIISDMQELKEWEWYSSKELTNGFEVIVLGEFLPRFTWFIHCQNIPLSNIWIKDDRDDGPYNLNVYKDVTSYKKFENL